MSGLDGVLLIDKPAGPTSHDVVQWVRWALRCRSVGHCGTLDPGATGLLVVCVGGATKLVEYLTAATKTYRARFAFGIATDSADEDGEVMERASVEPETVRRAMAELPSMAGTLQLAPPAISALKIDGVRAHERARAGEDVVLDPRPMEILEVSDVEDLWSGGKWSLWCFDATLRVSKGTYIRSIAVELGRRVGAPAHLAALHRTHAGQGSVDDPRAVRSIGAQRHERGWRLRPDGADTREACGDRLRSAALDPAELLDFPLLSIDDVLIQRLAQGQRLSGNEPAFAGLPTSVERVLTRSSAGGETSVVVRVERLDETTRRIAPEKVLKMPDLAPA
jgi:tRNA pseudouridine55 synthase